MARVAAAPGELAVRPGEDPWTPGEVAAARTELMEETARLRLEIVSAEDAIAGLMRDSGDGAGDDEADTGTKNITREHELALASNAREMLHQTERALGRAGRGHLRAVRELRQRHRQGADAGLPARDAVRGVQAETGAPLRRPVLVVGRARTARGRTRVPYSRGSAGHGPAVYTTG